jgi:LPXTG-motif cell wall-anchored protein
MAAPEPGNPGSTLRVMQPTAGPCSDQQDAALCDVDGDKIPDWTEVRVCGSTTCADPGADTDQDGVPDFAETLTCASQTCSNGREDSDGNGIANWIDYVICGSMGCATGQEDFDGNGVSDAAELAACVKTDPGFLASTGFQVVVWVLIALVLLGIGALLYWGRRKRTPDGGPGTGGPGTGDRGSDADGSSDVDDDDPSESVRYWV